jgi:hypothetical protein
MTNMTDGTANYPTSQPARSHLPDDSVSEPELKLLRRLRTLRSGVHLCIIHADGSGVFGLTLLDGGKLERLRRPESSDL